MKKYKISFCTVCMNRLQHLRETLPANIKGNVNYGEVEFVLLDYNSSDGLEEYVRNELTEYIDSGILKYYKTLTPTYFRRAHSRNVAFKLATGDLVCNLDADNFTGDDFAFYINEVFQATPDACLNNMSDDGTVERDVLGRICLRKADFIDVTGFDEYMDTYGYEDFDLIYRLEQHGLKLRRFEFEHHLKAIIHGDEFRVGKEYIVNTLEMVLLRYVDDATTEALFIHNDATFKSGVMIDNYGIVSHIPKALRQTAPPRYRYTIKDPGWTLGNWSGSLNDVHLESEEGFKLSLKVDVANNCYQGGDAGVRYYPVLNREMLETIVLFNSEVSNRMKMEKNINAGNIRVNQLSFGDAVVFRNFDFNSPISV